jgi:hypothetical protein
VAQAIEPILRASAPSTGFFMLILVDKDLFVETTRRDRGALMARSIVKECGRN